MLSAPETTIDGGIVPRLPSPPGDGPHDGSAAASTAPGTPDLSLREIVDERLTLDEFLAEHEGELTPEIEALLKGVEAMTAQKVESIAWFVRSDEKRIGGIDAQIKHLQKRKQAIEARSEWIKEQYLREQMTRLGHTLGNPLKGTLCTVRFQLNNPKLDGEVHPERLVELYLDPAAQQFVRYTPEEFALDKVKTLAALKTARALLTAVQEARAALADSATRAKHQIEARTYLEHVTSEQIAEAEALVARFPELTIVRDESVRIV